MTRRRFAGLPLAVALAEPAPRFVKGICSAVFPAGTPYADCFRLAQDAGFSAIEIRMETGKAEITPDSNIEQMHRLREAAALRHIEIASLWILTPRSPSLASSDPAVHTEALRMVKKGIELAPALGCGALLVAAGVLGRGAQFEVTHDDAWAHASAAYREVLPLAARAKVMLTPENVWSKFLVSPRDMRSFIDQFKSPWVRAHFDVGNVMQYGYPQDWILTLGERIRRVHFKDFKLAASGTQGQFVPLLEGDVQWKEVMADLVKVGYRGFISAEAGPDPADPGLKKVSRAMDKILGLA